MEKYILKLFSCSYGLFVALLVVQVMINHYDEPALEEVRYYVKYEVHMNIK